MQHRLFREYAFTVCISIFSAVSILYDALAVNSARQLWSRGKWGMGSHSLWSKQYNLGNKNVYMYHGKTEKPFPLHKVNQFLSSLSKMNSYIRILPDKVFGKFLFVCTSKTYTLYTLYSVMGHLKEWKTKFGNAFL